MGSYKEAIMRTVNKRHFRSASIEDFKKILDIRNSKKERQFKQDLYELIKEGKIVETRVHYYNSPQNLKLQLGKVTYTKKDFIFVEDMQTKEEFYVPSNRTKYALKGDIVFFRALPDKENGSTLHRVAKIVSIVKRNQTRLVGTCWIDKNKVHVEVLHKGTILSIPIQDEVDATYHGKVVSIVLFPKGSREEWKIETVLGDNQSPTTEILSILYKNGMKVEFEEEALKEAKALPEKIPEEEYYRRKDLRDEVIVTMDGEEAKDLDDAISLSKNEKGHFVLGVHIADVSYYVTRNSALDKEAFERGTSVYLTDRVVPMLPPALSNNLCSLHPHEDKLTITCEMEINQRGKVISYQIFPSIIRSQARLTYEEVNQFLDGKEEIKDKYKSFMNMLIEMNELRIILRKKRERHGAIQFDVPEAEMIVNEQNKPLDIQIRVRGNAEKIIEEFMLIANETVAKHFYKENLPFLYRVHEHPKEEKVDDFSLLLEKVGQERLRINEYTNPKSIQKSLKGLKNLPIEESLKKIALRIMSKAEYHSDKIGHFGLAKTYYTHFTSPIRRYPDLIVHRLIREYLFEKKRSKKVRRYWERELPHIASHSSKKERQAMEAEQELLERKKCEFMQDFIGKQFEGSIVQLQKSGLYIQLSNTVRGMITMETLGKTYYFDEETYMIKDGKGRGEEYRLGEKIKVELIEVDIENQEVIFRLADS